MEVTQVRHPAPFSDALLEPMIQMLKSWRRLGHDPIYDPMAGSGERLGFIATALGVGFCGCEIEPEFIARPEISAQDCTLYEGRHRIILTSPAYGNRMADQYLGTPAEKATRAATGKRPRRRGYAVSLGRKVSAGSGAGLRWGDGYRSLHGRIMQWVVWTNLDDGGVFLLNVGSHYRGRLYQPVGEWYLELMLGLSLHLVDYRFVETPGFRDGDNRELRVGGEHLYLFQKVAR